MECAGIMRAWAGGAVIQVCVNRRGPWLDDPSPSWNWSVDDYRIKPKHYPICGWAVVSYREPLSHLGAFYRTREEAEAHVATWKGNGMRVAHLMEVQTLAATECTNHCTSEIGK